MRAISRSASKTVLEASRSFPAIIVTGPRRAGKTTLLRQLFPGANHILLEDPEIQARARSDPRGLLESDAAPVFLDEIQNVPDLLDYIRTRVGTGPSKPGQWLFAASQEAPLMQGVTESMAGRAALLQLYPLSLAETGRVCLLHGGYPEVLARPAGRQQWFRSSIQSYLERDVRAVTNVRNLATFRRFLALLASRHGQILNKTDLAAPLGVSVPTIADWLHILEVTCQIILVPPYFENFGKRLSKSPKVYLADSGLACHLLGIQTEAELDRSPFRGALFEGFVAAEIVKSQVNQGRRKELYHFRDEQGLEVNFLTPSPEAGVWMVECKASHTVVPAMASRMASLRRAIGDSATVRMTVVHEPLKSPLPSRALAPGAEALDLPAFVDELNINSIRPTPEAAVRQRGPR